MYSNKKKGNEDYRKGVTKIYGEWNAILEWDRLVQMGGHCEK